MDNATQEEDLVYHVVSWAPDGHRTYHLIVSTLEAAVEVVRDMAARPEERPAGEDNWIGETVRLRAYSHCRPWVQIYVGGRQAAPEEQAEHTTHALRGVRSVDEARAVLNEGPQPMGVIFPPPAD